MKTASIFSLWRLWELSNQDTDVGLGFAVCFWIFLIIIVFRWIKSKLEEEKWDAFEESFLIIVLITSGLLYLINHFMQLNNNPYAKKAILIIHFSVLIAAPFIGILLKRIKKNN